MAFQRVVFFFMTCFIFFILSTAEVPHHYALVLDWPISFCNVRSDCINNPVPSMFTIHGLWPRRKNGDSITSCDGPELEWSDLSGIEYDLNKYWPSYTGNNFGFWRHEWNEHGKCSGDNANTYFNNALNIFKILDGIDAKLMAKGVKPRGYAYPFERTEIDIQKALGDNYAQIQCNSGPSPNSKSQLLEIYVCASMTANSIQSCGAYNTNCEDKITYPPPKSATTRMQYRWMVVLIICLLNWSVIN